MKHIAIVPARSGSKGLPDKNIKPLCGKPLLAYTIEAAQQSGRFDTVHLSTDSEQYAAIGRQYGAEVPFLRSTAAASDTATTWEAVLEVLHQYEQRGETFDTVTVLQPTTPLRTAADIQAAFDTLQQTGGTAVVSVCECEHSPLWSNTLPATRCMDGFIRQEDTARRQEHQAFYRLNGAVYLITTDRLLQQKSLCYDKHTYASVMPAERSVDIDTALDFAIAEAILSASQP